MNPFSFGSAPWITKKCPHCDTTLEFESAGKRFRFTAHDEAFCNAGTRERVRMLEQVLLSQREAYERKIAAYERRVDATLAKHGLPSMRDQANEHELEASRLNAIYAGMGVTPDLLIGELTAPSPRKR